MTPSRSGPSLADRIRLRIRRWRESMVDAIDQRRLGDAPFCLITNNCLGGRVYRRLGRPYNSPFVDCGMHPMELIRIVERLDDYLATDLEEVKGEPKTEFNRELRRRRAGEPFVVASLGDVELRFLHSNNFAEIDAAWKRRRQRFDAAHLVVLATQRNEWTPEASEAFEAIEYPRKLQFVLDPRPEWSSAVRVPEGPQPGMAADGNQVYNDIRRAVDLPEFLRTGNVRRKR